MKQLGILPVRRPVFILGSRCPAEHLEQRELIDPEGTSLIPTIFIPSLGTGFFELKVIIKNNFISVFYNDLLILTLFSTLNSAFIAHGIITSTNDVSRISCHCFKILNN